MYHERMTKSFWDSQSAKGASVETRMATQGQSVKDITEQSGDMSCAYYNEPQDQRFTWKPNYKGKDGKGSLESVRPYKNAHDQEGENEQVLP